MKLRIVSGYLKGRYLSLKDRDSDFRPTRERVRESVANILASRCRDASVADVCAGSGAFGFEMLSRGARSCTFIENDRFRVKRLREHAERFDVAAKCEMVQGDLRTFLRGCTRSFDIIYFDPPYDDPEFVPLVPELAALLTGTGILIYERRRRRGRQDMEPLYDTLSHIDKRIYGETEVWLCTRSGSKG